MTEHQERTYQAQTITPPALKARKQTRKPERQGEHSSGQSFNLEDKKQKKDIIIRLIDCIKSI